MKFATDTLTLGYDPNSGQKVSEMYLLKSECCLEQDISVVTSDLKEGEHKIEELMDVDNDHEAALRIDGDLPQYAAIAEDL